MQTAIAASRLESSAGIFDHLLRVGIDLSRDPGRSARSAAVSAGWDEVSGRRTGSVRMDAREGNSVPHETGMGWRDSAGGADFRLRLRAAFLGGTARAVGSCRSHVGNDSSIHGTFGDHHFEDATANDSSCRSAPGRHSGCRCAGEPFRQLWRCTDRSCWRMRFDSCRDQLVGRIGADPQSSIAG